MEWPCSGQASASEYWSSSPGMPSGSWRSGRSQKPTLPCASLVACSTASAMRPREFSRMTMRSTTTSTVCLSFFSSLISSSSSRTSPSTRTREKPS